MNKYNLKSWLIRLTIVFISVFFTGLGSALMRLSSFGTEAFMSLNYSISEVFKLPLGNVMIGLSIIILLFAYFLFRRGIGPGTIIVLVVLGYSADIWAQCIVNLIGPSVLNNFFPRVIMFLIGMLIMVFSTSIYMTADVGMAPYDTVGYIIQKVTGIPFQYSRMICDFTCVGISFLIALQAGIQWELIGIGTLIMASCVGPLLNYFIHHIATPWIDKIVHYFIIS